MMRSVSAVSPVSSVVCEVGDSTAMADGATELSLAGVAEGSWASASQTKRKTPAMIARHSLVLGGLLIPTHSYYPRTFLINRFRFWSVEQFLESRVASELIPLPAQT